MNVAAVAAGEFTIENVEVAEHTPVARYTFCKQVLGAAHAAIVSSVDNVQFSTALCGFWLIAKDGRNASAESKISAMLQRLNIVLGTKFDSTYFSFRSFSTETTFHCEPSY